MFFAVPYGTPHSISIGDAIIPYFHTHFLLENHIKKSPSKTQRVYVSHNMKASQLAKEMANNDQGEWTNRGQVSPSSSFVNCIKMVTMMMIIKPQKKLMKYPPIVFVVLSIWNKLFFLLLVPQIVEFNGSMISRFCTLQRTKCSSLS